MPVARLDGQRAREGAATLGEARAMAAAETDRRIAGAQLAELLRPGPRSSLDPIAPGPRNPVQASPLLSIAVRMTARKAEWMRELASHASSWAPRLTADQYTGQAELRRSIVGRSAPLSYVYRFLGWTGFARDQEQRAAAIDSANGISGDSSSSGGAGKLPCVDCG